MTTDDLEAPLFPRWVTFFGAFTCFMATALALMAQTARGAQTEEVAPEERRKCASIRALCNFFWEELERQLGSTPKQGWN